MSEEELIQRFREHLREEYTPSPPLPSPFETLHGTINTTVQNNLPYITANDLQYYLTDTGPLQREMRFGSSDNAMLYYDEDSGRLMFRRDDGNGGTIESTVVDS
jgi:hypothetical protein